MLHWPLVKPLLTCRLKVWIRSSLSLKSHDLKKSRLKVRVVKSHHQWSMKSHFMATLTLFFPEFCIWAIVSLSSQLIRKLRCIQLARYLYTQIDQHSLPPHSHSFNPPHDYKVQFPKAQRFFYQVCFCSDFSKTKTIGHFHTRGWTNCLRWTNCQMSKQDKQIFWRTNHLIFVYLDRWFFQEDLSIQTNQSTTVWHKITSDGQMVEFSAARKCD